jgi:hypothetical protein
MFGIDQSGKCARTQPARAIKGGSSIKMRAFNAVAYYDRISDEVPDIKLVVDAWCIVVKARNTCLVVR